jgi:hypothetical protein
LCEKRLINRHQADRKKEPSSNVEEQAQADGRGAERQVIKPEDEKGGHSADDQVQLYAGIAPKQRDQADQGDALGSRYDESPEDLVDAMPSPMRRPSGGSLPSI